MGKAFRGLAERAFARLRTQDDGQTLVEYVLITGLVSIALVATLIALAGDFGQLYTEIISHL